MSLFRCSVFRFIPFRSTHTVPFVTESEQWAHIILALLFRCGGVGEWFRCVGGLIFRWNGILCKDRKSNFFMYFILRENKNNVKFIKGFFSILCTWKLDFILFCFFFRCVFICKDCGGRMRIMEKRKRREVEWRSMPHLILSGGMKIMAKRHSTVGNLCCYLHGRSVVNGV